MNPVKSISVIQCWEIIQKEKLFLNPMEMYTCMVEAQTKGS